MSKNYLNQTDCIELNLYVCCVCAHYLGHTNGNNLPCTWTTKIATTANSKPANNNNNKGDNDDNINTTPIILFPKCCCYCCFISGFSGVTPLLYHEKMDLKQLVICIERNTLCVLLFCPRNSLLALNFPSFSLHKTFFKSILIWCFWNSCLVHTNRFFGGGNEAVRFLTTFSFKCVCSTRPILSLTLFRTDFCTGNVKAFWI